MQLVHKYRRIPGNERSLSKNSVFNEIEVQFTIEQFSIERRKPRTKPIINQ